MINLSFGPHIRSLSARLLINGLVGCFAGLFLLHPFSMFIYNLVEHDHIHPFSPALIFSPEHVIMAGYFGILGALIGTCRAFYIHRWFLAFEKLERLSFTDGLTSLYNRRYLDDNLKTEIDRARRYSRDLSLLLIDMDRFKLFNDKYGHSTGDELLKEIAGILRSSVRKPDFVARYGWDEFVIIMPETNRTGAREFEERLQAIILDRGLNRLFPQVRERVTVSVGSASFPAEAGDIDGLFNLADKRLYKVKHTGADYKKLSAAAV